MPSSCPPFTSEAAFPTDVHGYSCSVFDRTVGFRGSGAPPLVRWSRRFMRSGLGVSPLGAPRPVISVDLGCGSCVWFVTDLRDPASGVLLASLQACCTGLSVSVSGGNSLSSRKYNQTGRREVDDIDRATIPLSLLTTTTRRRQRRPPYSSRSQTFLASRSVGAPTIQNEP